MRRSADVRDRFRRAVAISVTGRFRDPDQYDLLRDRILPDLLAKDGDLRVWSAGCATGLEVYGLATLLDSLGALDRARFLGSDLLEQNIEAARRGDADGVPPSPAVAARTRWEVRDLTQDGAPEGRFDLILCRNVGIYFTPAARARLMEKLSGALAAQRRSAARSERAPVRSGRSGTRAVRAARLPEDRVKRTLTFQTVFGAGVLALVIAGLFLFMVGAIRTEHDAARQARASDDRIAVGDRAAEAGHRPGDRSPRLHDYAGGALPRAVEQRDRRACRARRAP